MKKSIIMFTLAASITACNEQNQKNQINSQPKNENVMKTNENEKQAIEKVIKDYFNALNESNVSNAIAQYANDGVFMPKEAPTASGQEQLKNAYSHVFKTLDFTNMDFALDEITVEGNFAIVRTSSLGDLKILANDVAIKGATHRELFVMKQINNEWKIARYMFNTTTAVH